MNETTAVVIGAVVIASAAAAVVWAMRSRPAGAVPAATGGAPMQSVPYQPPPQPVPYRPPPQSNPFEGAAKAVGGFIQTGSNILKGVTDFFKGFKL